MLPTTSLQMEGAKVGLRGQKFYHRLSSGAENQTSLTAPLITLRLLHLGPRPIPTSRLIICPLIFRMISLMSSKGSHEERIKEA